MTTQPRPAIAPAVAIALLMSAPLARAAEAVEPPQVYQAVQRLSADIGLVRAVMGKPVLSTTPWAVEAAEPRHVFYQAQTLYRKANRLAVELGAAERQSPRAAPEAEIQPSHVLAVVEDTQVQIDAVRGELGINLRADPPPIDRRREPRDVLEAIVQASRQLNLMLDLQFRPEDVYDRVVLAATYVAGALTDDPERPQYGDLPPLEPAKTPADVYRRVMECLELVSSIAERTGIAPLKLNLRAELRRRDIAPADVYDVATTVLSEVAWLTLTLNAMDVPPPPLQKPEHVFPSHVYQLTGMLQDAIAQLDAKVR